jgi:hypothetical protein
VTDTRRRTLLASIPIIVAAACGGRSNLGLEGASDGTSSSGGGGGRSGSGAQEADGSSDASSGAGGSGGGGASGSSGAPGSGSGLPFDGGYPDFPDAYGSTPSTCDEGPPPESGEACSNLGATCFVPNPGHDCRELQCECEPPGVFNCQGLDCYDGAVPFSDAGLVDGPAACPSTEPGAAPCFNQGVVCSYSNGCVTNCLCTGPEWVCVAQSPCTAPAPRP